MILVTGGAGYIGSHYVLYERSRGEEVVVLDNLIHGHPEAVLDTQLVVGDVGDRRLLDTVLTEYPITAVVHFAAFASVPESVAQPHKYYTNNVVATLTLLEAMRAHNVQHLVFSSSAATFGNPVYTPIDEAHPQNPINPYGESKQMSEKMMAAYDRAFGLRFVSLRYFNAAGADPQGRIGESHDPESHLIPIILQAAAGKRESVNVYGADYDTPDGSCIRDYVHILDLAQAHALALDALRSGAPSAYYNLGSGHGYSVREVIRVCEEITGRSIKVVDAPRRPGDPAVLVASAAKAKAELGWKPRFQDLAEIVRTAWNWEQSRRY